MWHLLPRLAGYAAGYALKEVDFQDLLERAAGLRLRAAPYTRANVVSAINEVLPGDRTPWTAQSLYLFISAFVRVDHNDVDGSTLAVWIRPKDDVVSLLLRGTTNDQSRLIELSAILSEECHEVVETLRLMVPDRVDSNEPEVKSKSKESVEEETRDTPRVLMSPIGLIASYGPALLKGTGNAVSGRLRRIREQRIIERLKEVLLQGGLSTHECYETLLALGMDKRNIDSVLRKDVDSPPTGR